MNQNVAPWGAEAVDNLISKLSFLSKWSNVAIFCAEMLNTAPDPSLEDLQETDDKKNTQKGMI